MRVAIDSGPLTSAHSVRGVGVSTRSLIDSLIKYKLDGSIQIDPVDFRSADLSGYDLLHYTTFNPYFLNEPRLGSLQSKIVLTIHDLIPLIYKDHYSPGIKGSIRFQANKFLMKYVDEIITVSETSKKDIVRFLGVDAKNINVVYWGVDDIFRVQRKDKKLSEIRKLYKLPDRFVLYVGDVNYNKNLSTLIKACGIVKIPLVIVGKQAANVDELTASWKNLNGPQDILRVILGKQHPELKHFIKLSSLIRNNKVITTGFVPNRDLVGIYNMASVYCQPSYYEGFGLPLLEAFSCEVPVVISKTQALVEIAAGAALIANQNSSEDFAKKISSLLNDSTNRLHLIRAGKTRSKDFSWEITAKKTLEIYRKALGITDIR